MEERTWHAQYDADVPASIAYERVVIPDFLRHTADKVPDAEYKIGLCLLELNHTADGIIQLQRVRDSYPNTAAARLARQKLQSLGLM